MKFGFTDLAYTIREGSSRCEELIQYFKENDLKDLRFGLNLVSVASRNPLGDIEKMLETFKYLSDENFRIHLYLFLSDDVSNAGVGECPKEWEEDSLQEIAQKLKNDCMQCVGIFNEKGIKISSYTVGNESEWGVCGYRLRERVDSSGLTTDEDFEWLRENLWKPTAFILKGCCEAIKRVDSDAKIVIHSDSIGKESFTYEYIKYIYECKVPFDAIGLTYNPWTLWDEDYNHFAKIKRTINKVNKFGKEIWICEYCYPNQIVTNGELTEVPPQSEYPYTREGQTRFHLDFMEFCKQMDVEFLFFWRPEHEKTGDVSYQTGMFLSGKMDTRIMDKIKLLRRE